MQILGSMIFPTRTKFLLLALQLLCVYSWPLPLDGTRIFNSANQRLPQRQKLATTQSLPHCSKAIVTVSQTSRLTRRSTKINTNPQMSLNIGVGQTICFRLQEEDLNGIMETSAKLIKSITTKSVNLTETTKLVTESELLHTLTLTEMEQYHSITERYRFAIPEVETNCICECNTQATTCQADQYKYGKCQSMESDNANFSASVCHRTFFPNQPTGNCGSGSETPTSTSTSRLCCQLRFQPYQNRRFTAVRLKASTTYAVLRYSIYGWENPSDADLKINKTEPRWTEYERRRIRVQLDGTVHNSVLDEITGLKLSIIGLAAGKSGVDNQLEPGMYFVEDYPNGGHGQLISQALNRITEHE